MEQDRDTDLRRPTPDRTKLKGVLFALSTTLVSAPGPVAARYARQSMTTTTYCVLWSLLPVLYACLFFTFARMWPAVLAQLRPRLKWFALMGALQAGGAWTFFWGMKFVDPTVSAFLGRTSTLFAVIIGVAVLKERVRRLEGFGMALTIAGACVICYGTGSALLAGMVSIVISSLFFAAFTAMAKVLVRGVHPFAVLAGSTSVAAVLLAVGGLLTGELVPEGTAKAFAVVAVAAFVGEFLGLGLFYTSMKYIGFATTSVIRSALPLSVAALSYVALGELPDAKGWAGGAVLMAGIVLITVANARLSAPSKPRP